MIKNTSTSRNIVSKTNVAFFALLVMLVGFFASRIVLSLGMMLFGVAGLWGVHPREWLKNKWWLLGVAWVAAYGISGGWSHDIPFWWDHFQVKFPFLILPLAVVFVGTFSDKQVKLLTLTLNGCVLAGISYSLFYFGKDINGYIESYSFAHVLPTIPKNDHIRFSIFVALAICWNVFTLRLWHRRLYKAGIVILSIAFGVYLHLLAARSGLLALYLFIILWLLGMLIQRDTRKLGLGLLLALSIAATLVFIYIPTIHRRFNYLIYTVETYRSHGLEANFSDMGRVISFDVAAHVIAAHPFAGVGVGDIMAEMKTGYDRWYPAVPEENMIIPHNQFLIVAMGCGIPVMGVFLIWVFYPLFSLKRSRSGFFLFIVWAMLLFPLLIEPMFEVQFGVFVYLFFLLLFYHQYRCDMLSEAVCKLNPPVSS